MSGVTYTGGPVLDDLVRSVAEAEEGTRNDALNRGAFLSGEFSESAGIDLATAMTRLSEAAERCGLGGDDGLERVADTIERAFADGDKQTEARPGSRRGR